MRLSLPFVVAALLAALVSGCGEDGAAASSRPLVVATTTQAADIARHVAGARADVVGVLPANADPHGYELRPQDLGALARADLIVRSGGDVDDWLADAIDAAGADAPVLVLADAVPPQPDDDPHWWQDPRNAILAAEAIGRALDVDPGAYVRELRALDREIAACVRGIPPERRKLVTTHDALGAYAARYGFAVVGTVIPSRSTAGQPSAGDVAALIDTIRAEGVPAIFAESSVDARVEEAIAREAGARIGAALYADTLAPGVSYVASLRANTRAIAAGLGAPCA
jgi:ABC-type Zn uptake system ZnuABC Zn-binding protein ZnuA